MRRIRPDLLVLAELELWPNLVAAAQEAGASVAVDQRPAERAQLSRLSAHPAAGGRGCCGRSTCWPCRTQTYAERFRRLGRRPESDPRHRLDEVRRRQTDRDNPATRRLAELAGFAADDSCFLAGSTQEPEEAIALDVFRSLSRDLAAIATGAGAPPPRPFRGGGQAAGRLGDRLAAANGKLASASGVRSRRPRILLVDAVGELGAWWGTAHIAFVGGSLGNRGGQNMIEPAAYGAAVSFGPNTRNFRDIVAAMLAQTLPWSWPTARNWPNSSVAASRNPSMPPHCGSRAQALVLGQQGRYRTGTRELLSGLVANPNPGSNRAGRRA